MLFEKKKIITAVLVDKKVCMYGYLKTVCIRLQRSLVSKACQGMSLYAYRHFTILCQVDIASFAVAHSLQYLSAYL